jgi:hypothetical protein
MDRQKLKDETSLAGLHPAAADKNHEVHIPKS